MPLAGAWNCPARPQPAEVGGDFPTEAALARIAYDPRAGGLIRGRPR